MAPAEITDPYRARLREAIELLLDAVQRGECEPAPLEVSAMLIVLRRSELHATAARLEALAGVHFRP